jgi:hypothetical protein
VSAHAHFLQLQGQKSEDVDHIALNHADRAALLPKERALLEFVKVLTLEPAKTRDRHVEGMRKAGWTDEQIFEASFITSLFAFFNRMADAYGLDYSPDRWLPPGLRPPTSTAAEPSPASLTPGQGAAGSTAPEPPPVSK